MCQSLESSFPQGSQAGFCNVGSGPTPCNYGRQMSPEFPKCKGISLHLCINSHLFLEKLKGCSFPIQTGSKPVTLRHPGEFLLGSLSLTTSDLVCNTSGMEGFCIWDC